MENLFVEQSIAAARAEIFALKAKKEGRPRVFSFFAAIAESRLVRARRFLRLLRGTVGNNEENLKEVFENDGKKEALARFIIDAETEGMNIFEHGLEQALMVEKGISRLKKYASCDEDVSYRVCGVCGHIHVGDEAPDNCPVCNAIKSKFKKIEI